MKIAHPTSGDYENHVFELGHRFDIVIVFDRTLRRNEAFALRAEHLTPELLRVRGLKDKAVVAHPIDDETSYAVVMHEMGHHLAPNGYCTMRVPKPSAHPHRWEEFYAAKLFAEQAAWEWAQHYIEQRFHWTAGMEATKQYALGTYASKRRSFR